MLQCLDHSLQPFPGDLIETVERLQNLAATAQVRIDRLRIVTPRAELRGVTQIAFLKTPTYNFSTTSPQNEIPALENTSPLSWFFMQRASELRWGRY